MGKGGWASAGPSSRTAGGAGAIMAVSSNGRDSSGAVHMGRAGGDRAQMEAKGKGRCRAMGLVGSISGAQGRSRAEAGPVGHRQRA